MASVSQKQSNHTHRPVTIRQLNEARQAHTDAEFRIDDAEVEYVQFESYLLQMSGPDLLLFVVGDIRCIHYKHG